MRKVILQMMVTLDGFFEGTNKEIDWHVVDDEFNSYCTDFLSAVDMILFGRVTYQVMESYWPTQAAIKDSPSVAERMNSLPKFVFSRTLNNATWNNTTLIKENVVEEISRLKRTAGKDIAVIGSANLSRTLKDHGLIDEYHIIVNPIVLGHGKSMFYSEDTSNTERLHLKLLKTKIFKSGNVLLCYSGS
jgi:dihydrofolate reductase